MPYMRVYSKFTKYIYLWEQISTALHLHNMQVYLAFWQLTSSISICRWTWTSYIHCEVCNIPYAAFLAIFFLFEASSLSVCVCMGVPLCLCNVHINPMFFFASHAQLQNVNDEKLFAHFALFFPFKQNHSDQRSIRWPEYFSIYLNVTVDPHMEPTTRISKIYIHLEFTVIEFPSNHSIIQTDCHIDSKCFQHAHLCTVFFHSFALSSFHILKQMCAQCQHFNCQTPKKEKKSNMKMKHK